MRATAGRSPRSSSARRTAASGSPAAFATASVITPACAPWRSSPTSSAPRNACSAAVARPNSASSWRRRSACEPAPAVRPMASSASCDLVDGQRRLGGRRRQVAQRGPADADLALQQVAREVGDDGGHLVRRRALEQLRERLHLGPARRERADPLGGGRQVGEQHPGMVPHLPVPSPRAGGRAHRGRGRGGAPRGAGRRRLARARHGRCRGAPRRVRRRQRARDRRAGGRAGGGGRGRRDVGGGHRRRAALGAGQAAGERLGGERPRRRADRPRRRRRRGPGGPRRGGRDAGGPVLRDRRRARHPRRAARGGRAGRPGPRRGDGAGGGPSSSARPSR